MKPMCQPSVGVGHGCCPDVVTTFSTTSRHAFYFKGTPSACQAELCPAKIVCWDTKSAEGNRELERRRNARAERTGDAPSPGRQHGAPYGRKPTGRGAAAGRLPRSRRQAGTGSNAPPVTAPTRAGRAVVLTPDVQSPRESHGIGAGTPRIVRGGPSTLKGTRRSFLTASQKASSVPTLARGATADPAGLTARARPEARPGRRAANLRKRGHRQPLPSGHPRVLRCAASRISGAALG